MGEEIRVCPREYIGRDAGAIDDVADAVRLLEMGAGWPATGGWSDQCAALVDAVKLVWRTDAEISKKKGG